MAAAVEITRGPSIFQRFKREPVRSIDRAVTATVAVAEVKSSATPLRRLLSILDQFDNSFTLPPDADLDHHVQETFTGPSEYEQDQKPRLLGRSESYSQKRPPPVSPHLALIQYYLLQPNLKQQGEIHAAKNAGVPNSHLTEDLFFYPGFYIKSAELARSLAEKLKSYNFRLPQVKFSRIEFVNEGDRRREIAVQALDYLRKHDPEFLVDLKQVEKIIDQSSNSHNFASLQEALSKLKSPQQELIALLIIRGRVSNILGNVLSQLSPILARKTSSISRLYRLIKEKTKIPEKLVEFLNSSLGNRHTGLAWLDDVFADPILTNTSIGPAEQRELNLQRIEKNRLLEQLAQNKGDVTADPRLIPRLVSAAKYLTERVRSLQQDGFYPADIAELQELLGEQQTLFAALKEIPDFPSTYINLDQSVSGFNLVMEQIRLTHEAQADNQRKVTTSKLRLAKGVKTSHARLIVLNSVEKQRDRLLLQDKTKMENCMATISAGGEITDDSTASVNAAVDILDRFLTQAKTQNIQDLSRAEGDVLFYFLADRQQVLQLLSLVKLNFGKNAKRGGNLKRLILNLSENSIISKNAGDNLEYQQALANLQKFMLKALRNPFIQGFIPLNTEMKPEKRQALLEKISSKFMTKIAVGSSILTHSAEIAEKKLVEVVNNLRGALSYSTATSDDLVENLTEWLDAITMVDANILRSFLGWIKQASIRLFPPQKLVYSAQATP